MQLSIRSYVTTHLEGVSRQTTFINGRAQAEKNLEVAITEEIENATSQNMTN